MLCANDQKLSIGLKVRVCPSSILYRTVFKGNGATSARKANKTQQKISHISRTGPKNGAGGSGKSGSGTASVARNFGVSMVAGDLGKGAWSLCAYN